MEKKKLAAKRESSKKKPSVSLTLDDESSDEASEAAIVDEETTERPARRPIPKQQMFKGIPTPGRKRRGSGMHQSSISTGADKITGASTASSPSAISPPRPTSSAAHQDGAGEQSADQGMVGARPQAPTHEHSLRPRGSNAKLRANKSSQTGSNIFTGGKMSTRRQSSSNSAVADAPKEPRLYQRHSQVRLAEKKSRDTEDRAPDPSMALLFDITKGVPPKDPVQDDQSGPQKASTLVAGTTPRDEPDRSPSAPEPPPGPRRRKSVRFLDASEGARLVDDPMEIDYSLTGQPSLPAGLSVGSPDEFLPNEAPVSSAPAETTSSSMNCSQVTRPSTECIEKKLKLGTAETIDVVFDGIPRDPQQSWRTAFSNYAVLEITHTFLAKSRDQIKSLIQTPLCSGVIKSHQHQVRLDSSAEYLRVRLLGLFYHHSDFNMIIFPARCDEWADLFGQEPSSSPEVSLRFHIFSSAMDCGQMIRPPAQSVDGVDHAPSSARSNQDTIMSQFFGFDYAGILPVFPRLNTHRFFLAFPRSQDFALSAVCRWLLECNPGCRMFNADRPGSWSAFRSHVSREPGVVIVHELLAWSLHRFPGLNRYLAHNRDTYWCFSEPNHPHPLFPSISVPGDRASPGESPADPLVSAQDCHPPHTKLSGVEPHRAFEFLRWWLENWAKRSEYRLVTAHNVHEYLKDLANEKSQARADLLARCTTAAELRTMAEVRGLSEDDCRYRHTSADLASEILWISSTRAGLHSENEDLGSLTYADSSIDPNDEQSLANWFGWWSSLRLDQFRKFLVLGSSSAIAQEPSSKRAERRIRIPLYTKTTINDPDALIEVVQRRDAVAPRGAGKNGKWHGC